MIGGPVKHRAATQPPQGTQWHSWHALILFRSLGYCFSCPSSTLSYILHPLHLVLVYLYVSSAYMTDPLPLSLPLPLSFYCVSSSLSLPCTVPVLLIPYFLFILFYCPIHLFPFLPSPPFSFSLPQSGLLLPPLPPPYRPPNFILLLTLLVLLKDRNSSSFFFLLLLFLLFLFLVFSQPPSPHARHSILLAPPPPLPLPPPPPPSPLIPSRSCTLIMLAT